MIIVIYLFIDAAIHRMFYIWNIWQMWPVTLEFEPSHVCLFDLSVAFHGRIEQSSLINYNVITMIYQPNSWTLLKSKHVIRTYLCSKGYAQQINRKSIEMILSVKRQNTVSKTSKFLNYTQSWTLLCNSKVSDG